MCLVNQTKSQERETNFSKKLETLFKMFKYLFWKCLRPSKESSNSSWAEMELNIIGHFEIFPISTQTKQIFIMRLLTPLAEYQVNFPIYFNLFEGGGRGVVLKSDHLTIILFYRSSSFTSQKFETEIWKLLANPHIYHLFY